jgi:outer membrane receptor protein involved in Fe transport
MGRALRATATVLVVSPFLATDAHAQQAGRVVGRIIDAASGQGITGAQVQVVGSALGALAGVDGRFTIVNVPAGALTLQARRLGFTPKTVTGVQLAAGQTVEQSITLTAATVQLDVVTVEASAERGSVSSALDQQRTATGVVNAITSEQIQRSPDADAAQAVQRVSGVSVQDGKYVFVRGLGERYTTASLNGTRLPSPEPERKVVPLDLFPSGLLQSVTTSKTFTPDQSGDFSGAQVDIRTREFPARRQVTYSAGVGLNDRASGGSVFNAPGVGGEAFALAGSGRALPANVRAAGNLSGTAAGQPTNQLINAFRNAWQVGERSGTPSGSFGASVGGNDPLFGQRIGYLLSGTYSYSQEVRDEEVRALAGNLSGNATEELNRFEGNTGRNSTLWGGLFNLSTLLGTRTRISLNNTYNRTADNEARMERGFLEDVALPVQVQRQDYVERSVFSSQLAGEHDLTRQKFDWAATISGVTRDQPDRVEFVQEIAGDAANEQLLWYQGQGQGAVRTFSELDEFNYEGRGNYQFDFGPDGLSRMVKVGGLLRYTERLADTRAYGISANSITDQERALPPEQLFGGALTNGGESRLSLLPLGQGGRYTAEDLLSAGFAMADYGLTDRLRLIGGARLEVSQVIIRARSTLGDRSRSNRDFNDVLPSLALNYKLTENQNLRLSGSRTLARPEYRELAAVTTRDVIGGINLRGNPDLVRTRIDNADARYEWYPNPGEVLSFGLFAKRFDNPIERTYNPTSTGVSVITFANADEATNYGAELEARKNLRAVAPVLEPFTAFANLTVITSDVTLGEARQGSSSGSRRLVGQAPYVVNGGLTYASTSGATSATLLYNRVGERINAAGEGNIENAIERPRDVLDFSLRLPVFRELSARLDAKNLLDARYVVQQGPVTREAYRVGRSFGLGLSWQP